VIHRSRPANLGVLVFPQDLDDLGQVFVLCRYDAGQDLQWNRNVR
jgi:hypothetical protein